MEFRGTKLASNFIITEVYDVSPGSSRYYVHGIEPGIPAWQANIFATMVSPLI